MARKASDGMRILADHIGTGKIKARVRIDQVYAQNQHETLWFRHPRGGRAKYLEGPLFENHRDYYGDLADAVLRPEGPSMTQNMVRVGRRIVSDAAENTPREFGDLMQSGELKVLEGTKIVHHDPPLQNRLTQAQLDMKDVIRIAMGGRTF